ncbi:MAG TPA: 16S rRNA (guanine(527)-N(7))-methyltransferase RsmG [Bryobacteraceae bacterium]|nr:16S rRNA (guanine(527)-N(7))-methyltransferase RsmG [Bryobacteraceae bacterium]
MRAKPRESGSFGELLAAALDGVCELSSKQIAELEAHYDLLQRWNQRMNLTAVHSMQEAVVRHYGESVFLAKVIRDLGGAESSIVDLGSGAGFPGVPIAVVLPAAQITLVEANHRKAAFLKESTRALPNISVLAKRSGDVEGFWAWMVSRAVRSGDVLAAAKRLASRIALLTSAGVRPADSDVNWHLPIPLPWSDSVVLVGDVPRGT